MVRRRSGPANLCLVGRTAAGSAGGDSPGGIARGAAMAAAAPPESHAAPYEREKCIYTSEHARAYDHITSNPTTELRQN